MVFFVGRPKTITQWFTAYVGTVLFLSAMLPQVVETFREAPYKKFAVGMCFVEDGVQYTIIHKYGHIITVESNKQFININLELESYKKLLSMEVEPNKKYLSPEDVIYLMSQYRTLDSLK